MPNQRREGHKIYSVPVSPELQKAIQLAMEGEQMRVGKGYTLTRADVIRKVLEENCHRYMADEQKRKTQPKGN